MYIMCTYKYVHIDMYACSCVSLYMHTLVVVYICVCVYKIESKLHIYAGHLPLNTLIYIS